MNNEDFKPIEDLSFEEIFRRQEEIFLKFMKIENYNKEWDSSNFDINVLEDQQLFKDFLEIRVVEELTESTLAGDNDQHILEEIIDAFNFLIETYILYGWGYKDLNDWNEKILFDSKNIFECYYLVVESIGACCNLLKNRLWKESQYLVDLYQFEILFKEIWIKFNKLCNLLGIKKEELFKIWSLKYQVNKFRLETKY
jgi:hypothetical protein